MDQGAGRRNQKEVTAQKKREEEVFGWKGHGQGGQRAGLTLLMVRRKGKGLRELKKGDLGASAREKHPTCVKRKVGKQRPERGRGVTPF